MRPQELHEALQEIPSDESECPDCRGVGGNLQTGEHCATCLATGRDPADLGHLLDSGELF